MDVQCRGGLPGGIVDRAESAFAGLLPAAGLIQIEHDKRGLGSEVRRGGALKAICPFSPMPMKATPVAAGATAAFSRATSAEGSD